MASGNDIMQALMARKAAAGGEHPLNIGRSGTAGPPEKSDKTITLPDTLSALLNAANKKLVMLLQSNASLPTDAEDEMAQFFEFATALARREMEKSGAVQGGVMQSGSSQPPYREQIPPPPSTR